MLVPKRWMLFDVRGKGQSKSDEGTSTNLQLADCCDAYTGRRSMGLDASDQSE